MLIYEDARILVLRYDRRSSLKYWFEEDGGCNFVVGDVIEREGMDHVRVVNRSVGTMKKRVSVVGYVT